jgi:hypothetical protein
MGGRLIPDDFPYGEENSLGDDSTDDYYRPAFEAWPKTPRLNRDVWITEKIDGTNCAILVYRVPGTDVYRAAAQSRNRMIFPGKGTDNYDFARFVADNEEELVDFLGEGRHFGEYWGAGIARKYGLTERRFSLFNAHRWNKERMVAGDTSSWRIHETLPLYVVPTIYVGEFHSHAVEAAVARLRQEGSWAARGFKDPEGIIVFHTASRQGYKVTLENDEIPKTVAEKQSRP